MPELDHLILGCPNLEEGIQEINQLTGVQAIHGGPHPGLGTHNALLSLKGPLNNLQYLEIIAPDPLQNITRRSMASRLGELPAPALITWAAKSTKILDTAKRSEVLGLAPRGPINATRQAPNGDLLAWQLLFVDGSERGLPFFIDWQDTPHPSASSPGGCVLNSFEVFSPSAGNLGIEFEALDLRITLKTADKALLKAVIESPKGPVELVSNGALMSFI